MATEGNTPRLRLVVAALLGLLAGAAAIGAGHLVAGFVGINASPYLAVGNTFIDNTPSALKDFAVRTFGSADKVVLLGSMAVVIAGVCVVAGLVSRRGALPGTVVVGALGVVGTLAILQRPDVGRLGPLAGATALFAGVLTFRWLHAVALARAGAVTAAGAPATTDHADTGPTTDHADTGPSTDTDRADGAAPGADDPSRRRFLVASGATAAAAVVAGGAGQFLAGRVDVEASRRAVGQITPGTPAPAIPAGADFAADGTPSFLTDNKVFYRVDTALTVPRLRAEDYSLTITGLVENELELSFADLRGRELVERTITMTCVSNEVGGPYISTANFVGVDLRELLMEAGVKGESDQIVGRSVDGFTAGAPTAVVMEEGRGAMLALAMNGEPLPPEHGFPVRMVVPGLYGYVSATKWLVELSLTRFDAERTYWLERGWGKEAPIKTMSRIDKPKGFERVPAGRVVVAGTAWAQPKGVDGVEVRVDDGPWTRAQLSTEVNTSTWRMWRVELDVPAGGHTVEARAIDRTGYVQTQDRVAPIPDGATGWHSVFFTAT